MACLACGWPMQPIDDGGYLMKNEKGLPRAGGPVEQMHQEDDPPIHQYHVKYDSKVKGGYAVRNSLGHLQAVLCKKTRPTRMLGCLWHGRD